MANDVWVKVMSEGLHKKAGGRAAKSVGSLLPKITKPVFEKFGFPAAALVTEWPAIVGEDIASYTAPEKLNWPPLQYGSQDEDGQSRRDNRTKSGATLVLRVEGPRALDIQFQSQQIMDRINTFFGYRAITALRIVQAPLQKAARVDLAPPKAPRPMPKTDIDEIENDRLRAALKKLEEGIARR